MSNYTDYLNQTIPPKPVKPVIRPGLNGPRGMMFGSSGGGGQRTVPMPGQQQPPALQQPPAPWTGPRQVVTPGPMPNNPYQPGQPNLIKGSSANPFGSLLGMSGSRGNGSSLNELMRLLLQQQLGGGGMESLISQRQQGTPVQLLGY